MSSHAAPRPLVRPLIALALMLLVLATLLAAPPARAADLLEVEPNNSTVAAQAIPLGSTVSGTFGPRDCRTYDDCDYFKLTAPSQGRLVIDLRFSDLLGTASALDVRVLDAAGTQIYYDAVSSAEYEGASLRALAMYVDAGTFYVYLRTPATYGSFADQSYSLKATVTPGTVETEKNGSTFLADPIGLGTTVAGSIFTEGDCTNTDCDYYRSTVSEPTKLSVDFRFSCLLGTGAVFDVEVYDNAGRRLNDTTLRGSDCTGEALRATSITAPAGNVYVRVYSPYSVAWGQEYTLTVDRTDPPTPDVDVQRLAGSDRQGTAVEVSKATFSPGVPVTYVATGAKFPDALAAAPAAAAQGGPLLLVDRDSMSQAVKDELGRLTPGKIVVVGSDLSVSAALVAELGRYAGSGGVERIGGVDRYDTADRIVRYAFPSGSRTAWVATGEKFPDALSASAAAGSVDAPVLLVNGGLSAATPQSRQLVTDLGATSLTIAGSAQSVSEGIKQTLPVASIRIGGTDRYDTSEKLNRAAFTAADTVYFATGENFPDALAGATAAGFTGSPLFAVHPDCVPRKVLDDVTALGASRVVLLGGPGTLSDDVARLKAC